MTSVNNLLLWLNNNWSAIVICLCLLYSLYLKVKKLYIQNKQSNGELAKNLVKEIILSLVAKAEKEYSDVGGAGAIKRSQVIEETLKAYPELLNIMNEDELVKLIDELINESLKDIRDIMRT